MDFKEIKKLISEKLNWPVQDIFYLCTDKGQDIFYLCTGKGQFSYYLVYKNHRIKCVAAIDELNGCVSGIWN